MPIIRRHRDRLAEHQRQALAQIGRAYDVRYTTGPARRPVDLWTQEECEYRVWGWPSMDHPLWDMQPCDRRRLLARAYRPPVYNLGW